MYYLVGKKEECALYRIGKNSLEKEEAQINGEIITVKRGEWVKRGSNYLDDKTIEILKQLNKLAERQEGQLISSEDYAGKTTLSPKMRLVAVY
jgi:hypothetical protein